MKTLLQLQPTLNYFFGLYLIYEMLGIERKFVLSGISKL